MTEFSKEVNTVFDSQHLKAVLNLKYTANFFSALGNKELEPYQISTPQYNILRILRGAKKPITMKLVKERMIEKSPNTTRLTDKLLDKELIERVRCKEDRRVVYVSITEKGLKLLEKVSFNKTMEQIERLTEEEASQLCYLLDKIRN